MRWFFGSMERVFVASRCYLDLLVEHGLPRARLSLLPRGVDADLFHPGSCDPRFYERSAATGSATPAGPREERALEMQTTIAGWHNRQS